MTQTTGMTTISAHTFESLWADLADTGRDASRGGYSRHLFDDADQALREWFIAEATKRGLDVEVDRNANIWAWWGSPGPNALVTGSHLDSVPGGGAFDGPLGVVSALLAIDELRARGVLEPGRSPSRPLAIVCFAEEEGGRFGLPCLGSKLMTGAVDPDHVRSLTDPSGVILADAARRVGFDISRLGPDPDRVGNIGTLIELHVEQGRLMRGANPEAAVAVGSGIVAHGRWRITITGEGNHAGTTAITDRRDPVVVAARAVLTARAVATETEGAVATIGRVQPIPGGTNVIASQARLWLDTRYGTTADTDAAVASIMARIRQHAANEGCTVEIAQESAAPEVQFDPALGDSLAGTLAAPVVATGAGHDAGVLAPHVPAGMLYVRNPSGISHAPGEFAETDDCVAGIGALADVLEREFARHPAQPPPRATQEAS